MTDLWHYTCDHGRDKIGDIGFVRPGFLIARPGTLPPVHSQWAWFTDLAVPDAAGLGLTMNTIRCDRTVHRYRVLDPTVSVIRPWVDVRRSVTSEIRKGLERDPDGVLPEHWWVCRFPVRCAYDPIREAAADVS